MGRTRHLLNAVFAATLAGAMVAGPARANDLDELLSQLADPQTERWQRVERQIIAEWSKSGSPAMDLLLQRGREALGAGETEAAIEHLTALTDHAPEFAEGWNARATALFRAGQYGPAMADIARALALNPQHFGALSGLGTILEETGRDAQALEVYRAARSIHPHQPVLLRAVERLEKRVAGQDA
jgi:Flp pilus assembly protein TadD